MHSALASHPDHPQLWHVTPTAHDPTTRSPSVASQPLPRPLLPQPLPQPPHCEPHISSPLPRERTLQVTPLHVNPHMNPHVTPHRKSTHGRSASCGAGPNTGHAAVLRGAPAPIPPLPPPYNPPNPRPPSQLRMCASVAGHTETQVRCSRSAPQNYPLPSFPPPPPFLPSPFDPQTHPADTAPRLSSSTALAEALGPRIRPCPGLRCSGPSPALRPRPLPFSQAQPLLNTRTHIGATLSSGRAAAGLGGSCIAGLVCNLGRVLGDGATGIESACWLSNSALSASAACSVATVEAVMVLLASTRALGFGHCEAEARPTRAARARLGRPANRVAATLLLCRERDTGGLQVRELSIRTNCNWCLVAAVGPESLGTQVTVSYENHIEYNISNTPVIRAEGLVEERKGFLELGVAWAGDKLQLF